MATNNNLGFNIDFPIYNADGTPFNNLILRRVACDSIVMSLGDKITGEVLYKDNTLAVTMQEYVEYNGVHYFLVNPPTVVRDGMVSANSETKGMTKYSFEFYHPMYSLSNFPFTDIAVTDSQGKYLSQNKVFSWMGTGFEFIAKINKNLDGTQWICVSSGDASSEAKLALLPSKVHSKSEDKEKSDVLSFDKQFVSDALKVMYDNWGVPFIIDTLHEGEYYHTVNGQQVDYYTEGKRFVIVFGLPVNDIYETDAQGNVIVEDGEPRVFVFRYGQGVGLKNNSRTPKNNKIITRLAGYGSERNIPYGYPQIRWWGDSRWDYTAYQGSTINYDANGKVTNTPAVDSYPLYNGIVGGEWVKLIKHPFTRQTLMPTIYVQTVFNKVSPYIEPTGGERIAENPDYDPDAVIVDYYDATNDYPHPIVPDAPSFEIHGFDDIKPELTEEEIVDAEPWNGNVDGQPYITWQQFLTILNEYKAGSNNQKEIAILNRVPSDLTTSAQSEEGWVEDIAGSYIVRYTFRKDADFYYIKYVSDTINFEYKILIDGHTAPADVWDDSIDDEGNYKQSYFKITLPNDLDFDIYACAAITEEMKINMRSGDCIGCTFEVQVDWEDYKKNFYLPDGTFDPVIHTQEGDGHVRDGSKYPNSYHNSITLIVKKDTETFGTILPDVYRQPVAGDLFVILGISLPVSYVTNAQTRLDEAMMEYMLENNVYYYDYPLKFDEYFLAKNVHILEQMRNNTKVKFIYGNESPMVLYIKQMTVRYNDTPLPQYDITLTDDVEIVLNQIGQVTDDVSRMRLSISELQKYYGQNVEALVNDKLSRVIDDVAQGRITFQKGIDVIANAVFRDELKSPNFREGLYDGDGWRIDSLGNAELQSLRVRQFLEVIELLVNRLQAQEGDTIFSDNDQIDYVEEHVIGDDTYYVLSLKEKWEGYFTSMNFPNLIVKGIINTLAANYGGVADVDPADCPDSDDGGNKYYTSWMKVISPAPNGITLGTNQICVTLYGDDYYDEEVGRMIHITPAGKNFPPCELMTIARWGCDADPADAPNDAAAELIRRRQRLFMISDTDGRITKLRGVRTPILADGNYGTTLGIIPDFIKDWPVYSRIRQDRDYLYAQGIIVGDFIKVDALGEPIVEYVDCGEWVDGSTIQNPTPTHGIYYHNNYNAANLQWETHDVWHNGSYWRCLRSQPVVVEGQPQYREPSADNPLDWEELLTSGQAGQDGENAVQVTLENQHEDFVYNDSGTNMTGEVTSQAHLWDGNTEPSSGVTWKVSCDGGVTFVSAGNSFTDGSVAKAKISSAGLLTVSEIKASPAKVVVQATYKGTAYTADFTANKTNQDKYELVLNPTGIPYNSATFTTQTISISAIRTDLGGTKTNISFGSYTDKSKISTTSGKGTLRLFARYKANSSSSETDYQVRATPLSITPTIAGANNGIYFELRKYADPDGGNDSAHTIADYQTVTINKAENGQNGQNGQDGQDASPVRPNILLRTIFDQGIDFVKEKWESNDWRYAIVDTATDTVVQGRKSIRLNANSSSTDVNFLQNVYWRVKPSTWYTLSFYSFSTRTPNAEGGFWYTFIYDGSSGSATQAIDTSAGFYVDGVFVDTTGNNDGHQVWNNAWDGARHTLTFKTNSSFSTNAVNILFRAKKEFNEQVCICMPKLEEGQDATAYVPNENDTLAVSYEVFCPLDNVVIPSDQSQVTLSSAPSANVFRISGSLRESYPLYYRLYWRAGTTYSNEGSASSSAVSTIPLPATYQSSYDALVVFVGKANTVSRLNYIAKAEVAIIRNGNTGAHGKMGRNIYYAGTITEVGGTYFSADDYQAPYVDVLTATDQLHPSCYVYVGANTPNPIQFPSTVSGYQTTDWEPMLTDFRYLITQAIFSQFAKLGGAIFNKDWLFSQYGLQDVTLYRNDSGDYVDELSWKVVPNQTALSVEEGYEYTYVIRCNKTSGASSNVTFRVFYSTDGGTNYTVGARAIGTSNTTRHDETMTFVAERTGLAKIYFYGYGYCYLIKTNRSSRYQDMSPEFPNSDASITLLANAMSTSSSDGVAVVNTSISVRQGYSYKFKARGYRQGSAGLTLFAKRVSDNTTVLSSILTISNTTATDASATVTIPSSVGSCDIQLWVKSGASGQNVILETLEVVATTPFVPTAAIDWLTGYAHFGGDKIRFNQDGSGFLAGGNVKWDKSGNTNVEGIVTAKMMYGQQLNIPWYAGIGTEVLTAYTIDPENNPANVFVARCTSNNGVRNLTITLPIAGDYEGLELKFLCSCSSSRYLRIKAQGSADVYFVSEYDGTYGWHSANTIQVKYDTLVVAQSIDGVWHVTQGAVGYSS